MLRLSEAERIEHGLKWSPVKHTPERYPKEFLGQVFELAHVR